MRSMFVLIFLSALACTKHHIEPAPPPAPPLVSPPKRAHHELVFDEANQWIVMTAGSTPLNGGSSYAFFNDVWTYDGKQWKQSAAAGTQRSGIRMTYDSKNHKIYSLGGYDGTRSLSDLRVFENSNWTTVTDLPQMKMAEAGFVYDRERDRFVAFGGLASGSSINDATWEWDRTEWKKFAGTGPAGRQAFVMVYDTKRKKTVVYGGMGGPGQRFDDTWEFDGTQWTKVATQGPGARFAPGFAYDSKRGILILFGGESATGVLGDTWSWDGTTWTKFSETGPSPRLMGYMAYDAKREKVVLFGGRPGWPIDADDTWEWDGTAWKEIK